MSSGGRKYMSKRSRACDSCRARKAACRIDGEPLCYLCTLHRKECTFLHPTNRSRRNPDRVLGKQRQLMINPAPAELQDSALLFDDLTSFGALASTRSSAMDPSSPREPGSVLGLINQNFSSLVDGFNHEPWPAGFSPGSFLCASPGAPRSLPSVEMAPENRKDSSAIELDDDAAETPVLLGSSGDMDPFLLRDYQYDASGNFHFKNLDIQSMATRVRPTQFLLAQPSIFATAREETGSDGYSAHSQRENLEVIVPEDIGHRLIDLFQRIIIPQYPIFSSSSRLDPRTSPPYLLASIYMLAESFIKFDERLCIDLAYEKPSAKALYQIINDAVSHAIHAPTLSIAETLFLLIIRPYPNPIVQDTSFKWTQLSTLVACAHSLGLHLDPRLWQIPPSQIAQRRRLSYFIYSVDKWLALGLGRPPMVNSETWSVTHLDAGDHLDSGISSLAWSADMKRSELDSLLDRVLKQLYSPRAMDNLSTGYEKVIAIAEPILEDIASMNIAMHPVSAASTSMERKHIARADRIFGMSYHYLYSSITRALLRPFLQDSARVSQPPEYLVARKQARLKTKEGLSDTVRFIHSLSHNDLEIMWPAWSATAFSSICFQILLMATSGTEAEDAAYWVTCLQQVRRDMRLKADVLHCLRLGLLRIDSIFWKGPDNVLHLDEHVRQAFFDHSTAKSSGAEEAIS